MPFEFIVLKGKTKGQTFPAKDKVFLGRSRGEITLDDPKVSNNHAQVEKRGKRYFLVDNNSSNGLLVYGEKVDEIELIDGAEFQVGRTIIRVQTSAPSQASPIKKEREKQSTRASQETRPEDVNGSLDQTADLTTKTRSWVSQLKAESSSRSTNRTAKMREPKPTQELPPTPVAAETEPNEETKTKVFNFKQNDELPEESVKTTLFHTTQSSTAAPPLPTVEPTKGATPLGEPTLTASMPIDIQSEEKEIAPPEQIKKDKRPKTKKRALSPEPSSDKQPKEPVFSNDKRLRKQSPLELLNAMNGSSVDWQSHLQTLSEELVKIATPLTNRTIVAFQNPITLEFIKGLQVDTTWIIGYGPRKIGARVFDCTIKEPGAPNVCFEITPTPSGSLFHTNHPQIVLYNDEQLPSHIINNDDTITIVGTKIKIKVDNEIY